jgi:hypothetical protein
MCQIVKYIEKRDENGFEKVPNGDISPPNLNSTVTLAFDCRFHSKFFAPKTALDIVRIKETFPGTCPRMLRSKTGCKTQLISRKEQKTYCVPPFAILKIPRGAEVH